jgi:hypothetical protein
VLCGGSALFSGPMRPMVIFEAAPDNAKHLGRTVEQVMNWLATRGYVFYSLRYPRLVPVRCESDLGLDLLGTDPWTDVLAAVPTLHQKRLDMLLGRFQHRSSPA